jgi:GNAT superfamily N-acetyltransferase
MNPVSQPKWHVREYRPEDIEGVRGLFGKVFHHDWPVEHFLWKFKDNPAGSGIISLAEYSGQIVGQYALMPTWLRLGNEVVFGAQSVDTMTHPDYRNQGMFTVLAKACFELAAKKGVEALYGFPNANAYPGFVRRLNWDHTGDVPLLVRFLNPKFNSLFYPVRKVASLGLHLLPLGNNAPHGIDIHMAPPADDEFTSLVKDSIANTDGICRVERSAEWLKWRFSSASQRRYLWFSAYRGGDLKALAVFGVDDSAEAPLIESIGSDPAALEAAVSSATRRAKELGLPAIKAVTNDEHATRALKACGYMRRGSLPLIVRSMTSRNLDGNIHQHSSWRISSSDLDTF